MAPFGATPGATPPPPAAGASDAAPAKPYAEVDVGVELGAGDATVHRLVAVIVVPGVPKLLAKVVDCAVLFVEPGAGRNAPHSSLRA